MAYVPTLTDEQRKEGLEKAMAARRERQQFRRDVKAGHYSVADAFAEPCAQRMRVAHFIASFPKLGTAKAEHIMVGMGIPENRRVQGLGVHQREQLGQIIATVVEG